MEIYSSEEQQVEAIKRFWHEYGKAIVGGVVIGLVSLYGWRYYQAEQRASAERVSSAYSQLLQQQDNEAWLEQAQQFIAEQGSNNYAQFTALLAAKEAVNTGDLAAAAQQLSFVQQHSKEPAVRALAQLRLARVQLERGEYAAALQVLAQPVPESFNAQLAEIKGDVLLAQGEFVQAKVSYQQALESSTQQQPLLQIKLDELAHIAATKG